MTPAHKLLDFLRSEYEFRSDRQLGIALGISAPVMSKIRNRAVAVSAEVMILIHEKTGMTIADIKDFIKEDSE